MKKTLLFMLILALMATGCKKKRALNYNDSDPISMALLDYHQIQASSHHDISYTAINSNPNATIIEVNSDGLIYGKNVGRAKVKLDNSYEERVIDVIVNLFREPTFSFGCSVSKIASLYGTPKNEDQGWLPGDSIFYYRYLWGSNITSWTCPEVDFFFKNGAYYEADAYIKYDFEDLLNNYLTDNFNYYTTLGDTLDVYKYKKDTTIICCKFASHNPWNEWCVFYYKNEPANSLDRALKNLPRSSKLRY